jgi:hypothetical protein
MHSHTERMTRAVALIALATAIVLTLAGAAGYVLSLN